MARPCQTTSLSPLGDIRVPPSFSSQSTYPDQSGSTSTRTNTPFMQKGENEAPLRTQSTLTNTPFRKNITVNIRSTNGTITPWSVQLFSTVGSFKDEFIHRAESTKIQLLDQVPGWIYSMPSAWRFTWLIQFQVEFIYRAKCTKISPTDSAPG